MDDIWRDALAYNKWANLQLLDECAELTEAQLQLTAPGTYGSIAATFMHLLGAEQRYVKRLTGAEPVLAGKDEFPGILPLKEHARRSGDALLSAAANLQAGEVTEVDYDGEKIGLPKSMIVVQAIHHGNDHRTHICTILGHHSIKSLDIDVWTYGQALHRGTAG
ncbi:MAG TPA: DinB family protein [Candidatus Dormibacteraeota bacterium]|nr:DinB family protein [Candidatus Dormibacteraeota bacterium]